MSIATLESTSSHLFCEALWTFVQSQSGTSASAFAHAWSGLMKDIPNLAVTLAEWKESKAPAWIVETSTVYGKSNDVEFADTEILVGELADIDSYVPKATSF